MQIYIFNWQKANKNAVKMKKWEQKCQKNVFCKICDSFLEGIAFIIKWDVYINNV